MDGPLFQGESPFDPNGHDQPAGTLNRGEEIVLHVTCDWNQGAARPIEGAIVQVGPVAGRTDERGEIRFEDLPLGRYVAFAEAIDPANPIPDLSPGSWTLTLQYPDEPAVSQTVIVRPGESCSWPQGSACARRRSPPPGPGLPRTRKRCRPPGRHLKVIREGYSVRSFGLV